MRDEQRDEKPVEKLVSSVLPGMRTGNSLAKKIPATSIASSGDSAIGSPSSASAHAATMAAA